MLSARDIIKTFGRTEVLKGVSLELTPGSITTLVGPSGSGKSTLLRAISLIEPPDSGVIQLDDRVYRFGNGKERMTPPPWPELAVVFQQLFLWPHLTIRENISLPLRRTIGGIDRVDELINLFGMSPYAERYPNQVSLGQRQLTAIARALALQPKYLLLDEITSALDVEYVSAILTQLHVLRQQGIGVLLITHLIGFARKSADQVLFMDAGQILESGGPQILTEPRTDRMKAFISLVVSAS